MYQSNVNATTEPATLEVQAVSLFRDLFRRLRLGWRWFCGAVVLTVLLILAGLAWTRLPDKPLAGRFGLTLLVPLLLAISALELQAGTARSFSDDDGKRVKLVWGGLRCWFGSPWALRSGRCWTGAMTKFRNGRAT